MAGRDFDPNLSGLLNGSSARSTNLNITYDKAGGSRAERRSHPASRPGLRSFAANLAELVLPGGNIVRQQAKPIAPLPGLDIIRSALTVQMVAERIEGGPVNFQFEELGQTDAPEDGRAHQAWPILYADALNGPLCRSPGLQIEIAGRVG